VLPAPPTHRRLAEAHQLWHQALDLYHDSDAFRANLNATIKSLRNITFVFQKEKGAIPDFDAWYAKWHNCRFVRNRCGVWSSAIKSATRMTLLSRFKRAALVDRILRARVDGARR
jgi:hypothetical protein